MPFSNFGLIGLSTNSMYPPANELTIELYLACDIALQNVIFSANPAFTTVTEPALITELVTQQQGRSIKPLSVSRTTTW